MSVCVCLYVSLPVGMVYDETKNYNNSFHVGGAMMFSGGLLLCLLHLPQIRRFAADANVDSMSVELSVPADEKDPPTGTRSEWDREDRKNEMTLTIRDDGVA